MTKPMMALRALVAKSAHADLLREMISVDMRQWAVQLSRER